MSVDSRGVMRGCCNVPGCSCFSYDGTNTGGVGCDVCGHPPGRHAKSSMTMSVAAPQPLETTAEDDEGSYSLPVAIMRKILYPAPREKPQADRRASEPAPFKPPQRAIQTPFSSEFFQPLPTCQYPNCQEPQYFDLNTGEESVYCAEHMSLPPPPSPMMMVDPIHTLPAQFGQAMEQSFVVPDGLSMQPTPLAPPNPMPPYPPQPMVPHVYHPTPPSHSSFALNLQTHQQAVLPPVPMQQQQASPQKAVPLLPDHERCIYPLCNKRRYREPDGKVHRYCGRYHAEEYAKINGGTADSVAPEMKCKSQGCSRSKRAREDGNGYYDYCGKTCRDGKFRTTPAAAGETCSLPGCKKPRYVDPANGRVHDYCGRTHANQAVSAGIAPQVCTIRVLGQSELGSVQAHFQSQWAKEKGKCPPITCVFEITNTQLKARWDAYRQTLPGGHQYVEQHYHGTKLTCDIVNTRSPCTDKNCGICGISKFGMFRECIRKNINFQRFGHGFYFAPNSSKCHDYTQGVQTYRAMLQVEILPGKKHTITTNDVKLTQPPNGCHSVYGKPGSALNYAELVVYNPDCVMPRYIIVYVSNGVHKIAK